MSEWPTVGAWVVVWSERPPSRTPREPYEGTVDHVAGRIFTVAGLEASFNRSTGRSKPVRHGAAAFGTETYVAVDADSDRAHQVLDTAARRDRDTDAIRAVHAWLAERSTANRRARSRADERHRPTRAPVLQGAKSPPCAVHAARPNGARGLFGVSAPSVGDLLAASAGAAVLDLDDARGDGPGRERAESCLRQTSALK